MGNFIPPACLVTLCCNSGAPPPSPPQPDEDADEPSDVQGDLDQLLEALAGGAGLADADAGVGYAEAMQGLGDILAAMFDLEADEGEEDIEFDAGSNKRIDYVALREKPLFEGSTMSVLQFAFVLLSEKRAGSIRDNVLDRLLRLLHERILPEGNNCPASLYVLKKVLGVKSASTYEEHVCINDKCLFPKLSHDEYEAHADDVCNCGERRFTAKTMSSGKKVYTPRKVSLHVYVRQGCMCSGVGSSMAGWLLGWVPACLGGSQVEGWPGAVWAVSALREHTCALQT
jgi:hypothetical protein